MKKIVSLGAIAAVSVLTLAACSSAPQETPTPDATGTTTAPVETVDYLPCMVSDAGGFDDKSFNQAGYEGLVAISEELGIENKTAESKDGNEYGPNIDQLVAAGCDLVITVGFLLGDATATAAAANPDTNFAMIDNAFAEPVANVKPILFNTNEAAFLAGYAAAATTQTGVVATFGGINIPPVTVFMDGFYRGVNYFNETTDGAVKVLGWDGTDGSFTGDFDDQTKGQNVTQSFIDQGADIILPVAGPVGLGAAAAAKTAGDTWIIGVDSDWTLTAPEYTDIILTSIMKNMGPAVHDVVNEAAVGAGFVADPYLGTLENAGVGLGTTNAAVTDAVLAELETIKAGIIDGSIPTS